MIVNTMTDKELENELLPEFRSIFKIHGHETSRKWMKEASKRTIFPLIFKKKYVSKKNNTYYYYGYFTDRKALKEGYMGICVTTMRTNKGICTFMYAKKSVEEDYIVMFSPHSVNRLVQRAGAMVTHEESTDEFIRRFSSDSGCYGYEYPNGDIAFYFKDGVLLGNAVSEHFKIAKTFVDKDRFYELQRYESEDASKDYEKQVSDCKSWHRQMMKTF